MKVQRVPLIGFPDVVLHADEVAVKQHDAYEAAKSGDIDAADELVAQFVVPGSPPVQQLMTVASAAKCEVLLLPIHALESAGVNEIPAAMAKLLSTHMDWAVIDAIVQVNTVGHTGASGYHRMAHQAVFAGEVVQGGHYFVVDDFVGQGGTLANLIAYVLSNGGHVIGATVLTGKPYSVSLAPTSESLQLLREKYGREFETWWQQTFGFDFSCLTRSEARYLQNSPDAQTVGSRLIEAGLEGSTDETEG